jgi:hypothetical protein
MLVDAQTLAPLSCALITPSYAPDFERCRLLVESVERHAAEHLRHYLIVDRRDQRLFSSLRSARTEVLLKQDVLPAFVRQVPGLRGWWWCGLRAPVRGWIVQQLVKLAVDRVLDSDVYVFVDSDTFLLRAFDPWQAQRPAGVPLFREQGEALLSAMNTRWHTVAAERLGLRVSPPHDVNYVTQLVTWRRDALIALHARLESRHGRPWAETLLGLQTLSEYVLYGVFVEHGLGLGRAGHYQEPAIQTLNYWGTRRLDEDELSAWLATLAPEQVGAMVSAKSGTDVATLRRALTHGGWL